jgi:hypothetical protein
MLFSANQLPESPVKGDRKDGPTDHGPWAPAVRLMIILVGGEGLEPTTSRM